MSVKMLEEDIVNNGSEWAPGTKNLFAVHENFLTGQFGLHIPQKYLGRLDSKYEKNFLIRNPFWVDERFINGEDFFAIGIGPLGFGIVRPDKNRRILDGNYNKGVIQGARSSARIYNAAVQDKASKIINDIIFDPKNAGTLLKSLSGHDFEEVVAELLSKKGFSVILTKKSRDGGKDIIAATCDDSGKPVLMLVECKNIDTKKTLGPLHVRALVGQFYTDKKDDNTVSYACLVTTAKKIGPAAIVLEETHNELSVKDFEGLMNWINRYGEVRNGSIWVANPLTEFV